MTNRRESKRAQELRSTLAERCGLSEEVVRAGLVAIVGVLHDRLPNGVAIALVSWVPEGWPYLAPQQGGRPSVPLVAPRGATALTERLVAAGISESLASCFISEFVRFVGARCGTPIAEALRRKVPELQAIEREAAEPTRRPY